MSNGICIYSEHFNDNLEPVVAELVSAAHLIKDTTGEPIKAIVVAPKCSNLVQQLEALDIDEIYAVDTKSDCLFQDDAISQVIADMILELDPTSVLVPATTVGRSLFSRVAAKLGNGLTADCTDLKILSREDESFYIKQNKPSFGENVMVSIITKQDCYPQMMTLRQGVYSPHVKLHTAKPSVHYFHDIVIPDSPIEVLETLSSDTDTSSILSAEIVVVGGRGALEDNNFELLTQFAHKIGGAIAGTRPLSDTEVIPFENQIGQTGCTIRPRICISLGVSGAIQHTEGIKDTKLFIAINKDKDAPIFNISDYGIVGDIQDILKCFLETE